jgi:sortase A
MSKKQAKTAFLPWLLMGGGVFLVLGSVMIWVIVQGPDQWAIWQLPTPIPVAETFSTSVPTATTPAGATLLVVTAVAGQPSASATLTPIPTPPLAELPSEARLEEAPTSMRVAIPGQPRRLVIPKIGVDATIQDVGLSAIYDPSAGSDLFYQWQVPQMYAVGWHHNSAPLGMSGNTVLNGHHNVFGEVFRDLEQLEVGDGLILYDNDRTYVYKITDKQILPEQDEPAEVRAQNAKWIEATPDERITLVTCWPYTGNTHRLVIVAKPAK